MKKKNIIESIFIIGTVFAVCYAIGYAAGKYLRKRYGSNM